MGKNITHIGGTSPVSLPGEQPSQSRTLPTDKQVLAWNETLSHWEPSNDAPNALTANEATKVTGVDAAGNDQYYGTNAGGTPGFFSRFFALDSITDVNISTPTDKFNIVWDSGTSKFIQSNRALGVDGVDASANFTYYGKNAGGTVGFHALPVIKTDLDSLDDVTITTPSEGDYMKFVSGVWVNISDDKLNTDEIRHTDDTTTTEVSIPSLEKKFAQAWVRFDGTGVPSITDSFNVSSVTDLNVGHYRVTFSTALSTANYAAMGSTGQTLSTHTVSCSAHLTTSVEVIVKVGSTGVSADDTRVSVVVFGGA